MRLHVVPGQALLISKHFLQTLGQISGNDLAVLRNISIEQTCDAQFGEPLLSRSGYIFRKGGVGCPKRAERREFDPGPTRIRSCRTRIERIRRVWRVAPDAASLFS